MCFPWQEQELYISELEGQNRVPDGKEVVHPLPGFVIKAKFTRGPKGPKDAVPEKVTDSRRTAPTQHHAAPFDTPHRATLVCKYKGQKTAKLLYTLQFQQNRLPCVGGAPPHTAAAVTGTNER